MGSSQAALPHAPQPLLDLLLKKAAHLAEYAVLAVLLHHALGGAVLGVAWGRLVLAWLLAVLYAASDEVHQAQVPGRTATPIDLAIDAVGAALGLVLRQVLGPAAGGTGPADRVPDIPGWDRV